MRAFVCVSLFGTLAVPSSARLSIFRTGRRTLLRECCAVLCFGHVWLCARVCCTLTHTSQSRKRTHTNLRAQVTRKFIPACGAATRRRFHITVVAPLLLPSPCGCCVVGVETALHVFGRMCCEDKQKIPLRSHHRLGIHYKLSESQREATSRPIRAEAVRSSSNSSRPTDRRRHRPSARRNGESGWRTV